MKAASLIVPLALAVASAALAAQQQPIRTGTNIVRVDVTVIDRRGTPVTSLTAGDFEVREDGQPQTITSFKLVEATGQPTDELSLPIRSPEHAAAEAARDDVRLFLIYWDEYHIEEFRSALFAREGLTRIMLDAFGPTDLVGIMDPLTPTDAIRFTRDRRALADQVHKLKGRRGVYFPRSVVEEEHMRMARRLSDIEIFRQQVTTSALKSAVTFLGTLREGRKSLILISETLGPTLSRLETVDVMSDITRAANDSNTAIFVFDPRGLTVERAHMSEMLETIAYGSGGQPLITNNIAERFTQVVKQSSAFYLIGYSKEIPQDGKFHEIKVKVKRPGLDVRARAGYWAPRAADVTASKEAAAGAALPPAVDAAFSSLTPLRSRALAEIWSGIVADAEGRPQVAVAWTGNVREGVPVTAESVSIAVKSGSEDIYSGDVAPAGVYFAAPPGPLELAFTIHSANGETVDRVERKLVVPDREAAEMALTTPVIVRVRNPMELRALESASALPVHAGRDFERSERIIVRFAVLGGKAPASVQAVLLDRRGAKLTTLPVTPAAARGGYQIDLPLSSIARGEYAVAIDARRGDQRAEAHAAFRVIR
jgi:VWFA-related protein